MLREEFHALAKQGFNRIPLVKEVLADLETPLSLYVKLSQTFGKKNTYLLESVLGGERFGRFSFIGLPAKTIIRTVGTPTKPVNEVITDGKVVETNTDNPLDFVDAFSSALRLQLRQIIHAFVVVWQATLDTIQFAISNPDLPNTIYLMNLVCPIFN